MLRSLRSSVRYCVLIYLTAWQVNQSKTRPHLPQKSFKVNLSPFTKDLSSIPRKQCFILFSGLNGRVSFSDIQIYAKTDFMVICSSLLVYTTIGLFSDCLGHIGLISIGSETKVEQELTKDKDTALNVIGNWAKLRIPLVICPYMCLISLNCQTSIFSPLLQTDSNFTL